jgi:dTDP-4-dehydrorhamnose reductase
MINILVTGANGQLGSEIRDIQSGFPEYVFLFTDIDTLDITDAKAIQKTINVFKPQIVINCAAYTAVDKAESDKKLADLINVNAPELLAIACEKSKAVLIHISTDYVFDGKSYRPYKETDHPKPTGYYAKTKLDGENEIQINSSRSVIIRTSWLYSSFGKNFVKTILHYAKERGKLNVVYDQVGSPTYARDLANAILKIIPDALNLNNHEIFHYANEGALSWYDFAQAIVELAGIPCEISAIESKDYPTPAPRPHYSVLNKNKFKTTFGIEIPFWRDSLKSCLEKMK